MIIDSHAHYAHARYGAQIPYLCEKNGGWEVLCGDREALLAQMKEKGIIGVIEPSIGFDAIETQRQVVAQHPACMWAAIGVHPTRCVHTAWQKRKALDRYVQYGDVVAIGETGLDYHHPRRQQYRLRQKRWFVYQLKLAGRAALPLVLHIRAADKPALNILKKHRNRLHGGVVHCFTGDRRLAEQYIALGLALGIGGKLLCDDESGCVLRDTVKHVPLDSILVETDAPYVLPDISDLSCHGNQRKKLCNSSFILPLIVKKIADLRGDDIDATEDALYRNTVRVFGLDTDKNKK